MHHGQSGESRKLKGTKIGEEFINVAEICGDMQYASLVWGVVVALVS